MNAWTRINTKFTALSSREKWLIFLCGLVGLFFINLTVLIDPSLSVGEIQQQQLKVESAQNKRLLLEVELATSNLNENPNSEIDEKLKKLSEKSQQLSIELSNFVSELVAPSEMAELLEDVLSHSTNLKLVSLKSLPAEPVTTGDGIKIDYYIHPVEIELTGKYFDIQAYLSALESMKAGYFWRNFQYKVEAYPTAKLVLVVYTLGTRREFIGG